MNALDKGMAAAPPAAAGRSALTEALLEAHLGREAGELTIGGIRVTDLAAEFGTPLYVYDADKLRGRLDTLRQAVAGFADVYYSIKANPNPHVAGIFVDAGAGIEVASGAEFLTALKTGCDAGDMLFAGPGKGDAELDLALSRGIGEIHLESDEELDRVARIADEKGLVAPVAIRVNPVAAAQGGAMRMGGKPAAFGFDEERLGEIVAAIKARPSLRLNGVHLFTGTQILNADTLLGQWGHAIDIASKVAALAGHPLKTIDLGGGLGVRYHSKDSALDLGAVRSGIPALAARLEKNPLLRGARIILEPGRYLTAPAGIYLMGVRAVKNSRGERFVVTDGGMHHHLAASGNLGQIMKRDFPIVAANRMDADTYHQAHIVGPLCTPLDTLGRQTPLPDVTAGDLICVLQSGAYGLTASPSGFLSQPMPGEVLVDGGGARLIRPAGTLEEPVTTPV